jgi:hypothetical protein
MEGVTVTFYNGSTSMGTADTNSSGVATKSYSSTGAGDVSFTASVGTLSSETYTLEDCKVYDTLTTNKNRFIGNPSNVNYTSDGYGLTANTNWTPTYYNYEMSQDMSIEFDFNSTQEDSHSGSSGTYSLMTSLKNTVGGSDLFQVYWGKNNVYDYTGSTKYTQTNDVTHIKYEITNNTVKLYANDSLVYSRSVSGSTFYWYWWSGGNRRFRIKNLKIKPL